MKKDVSTKAASYRVINGMHRLADEVALSDIPKSCSRPIMFGVPTGRRGISC